MLFGIYIKELQSTGTIRGNLIEDFLAKLFKRGGIRRLPKFFKTFDFVQNGKLKVLRNAQGLRIGEIIEDATAISLKSIDLRAKTFTKSAKEISSYLKKQFIDPIAEFTEYTAKTRIGKEVNLTIKNPSEKILLLRYGPGKLTDNVVDAFEELRQYAHSKNINIEIAPFR